MTKRKNKKKGLYWLCFFVLLAIGVAVCYFVWDGYFKKDKELINDNVNDISTRQENKKEKTDSEQNKLAKQDIKNDAQKEEIVQYEGNDPNEAPTITGVVTYAGVSNNTLMIRVNIDQYLESGSCVLSLLDSGNVMYGDSANVVDSASTATCEGFNIPLSEIGGGDLKINIEVFSGDKSGVISGEVNI